MENLSEAKLIAAEPQLFVADVDAACAFYRDRLGFAVRFVYGEPPFYAQVFRGGASLNLRAMDEAVFLPVREQGALLSASIPVEGIAALYAEFQAAGVSFAQELKTEAWGAQTFVVRDPDGNLILFAE